MLKSSLRYIWLTYMKNSLEVQKRINLKKNQLQNILNYLFARNHLLAAAVLKNQLQNILNYLFARNHFLASAVFIKAGVCMLPELNA